MSRVYFISDLHLGHKSIINWSREQRGRPNTIHEHDQWIVDQWNSVVNKKDKVFVLGDVCFDMKSMYMLDDMYGEKVLIRGNHDKYHLTVYLRYFRDVQGFVKYKDVWLSHSPIHPLELRGKKNVHGHVHNQPIPDDNYISVCVEALNGVPISYDEIKSKYLLN